MALKNECIFFPWGRRWGNPGEPWEGGRGGCASHSPQEGAAAGSLKTGWCVTASGFLAHSGKPQICYGDNTSREQRKTIIFQEAAWDTAGEKLDLDCFLA